MNDNSLEVYYNDELIFSSKGKWLYPLIELEEFLSKHDYDREKLFVEDKIAGRAAAGFGIALGIKHFSINLISSYGLNLYKKYDIDVKYSVITDYISCNTEKLITPEMIPSEIHDFIIKRVQR